MERGRRGKEKERLRMSEEEEFGPIIPSFRYLWDT